MVVLIAHCPAVINNILKLRARRRMKEPGPYMSEKTENHTEFLKGLFTGRSYIKLTFSKLEALNPFTKGHACDHDI